LRVAVIDLGTNTFNLLIADRKANAFLIVHQEKFPVKLGEGGLLTKSILPKAFDLGVATMVEFSHLAKSNQCDKVLAYATATVREAKNGIEFKNEVFKASGIEIEIIDGKREAELIAIGASKAVTWAGNALIMDIGGGSAEFIIANNRTTHFIASTNLGVSRLKEMFSLPETCVEKDLVPLRLFIQNTLTVLDVPSKTFEFSNLIGCAGSFDSLVDITSIKSEGRLFDFVKNTSYNFNIEDLLKTLNEIIYSSEYQRAVMPGLPVFRQPYMVYACVLIQEVILKFGIETVCLSSYSLKEGAFYESSN
jgi:exopolyphosphatase/guanosine-5'-triphosphate,3'-diphosphate pyrophosphatase